MMTMTDQLSTPAKKGSLSRKKLFAMLAAVVIIVSGITLTSVGVANANAEETARQCTVATKNSADATKAAKASLAAVDTALEAVTVLELPEGAGTSTDYAARPGVEAVKVVPAVEASDGVEAVAGVDAIEARADGAGHIAEATTARAALVKIKFDTKCSDRDHAAALTATVATAKAATKKLETSVTALGSDFAAFQTDEAARIAAEIEAARVAAEIEAARVAAEAEAARVAAEAAEAARVAANAQAAKKSYSNNSDTGSSYSGGGSSSGGGSYSAPAPAPAPEPPRPSGPPNGGSLGLDTSGPGCLTSNGMGGTKPC
jgi:uncharacterized membrane protein YgcG